MNRNEVDAAIAMAMRRLAHLLSKASSSRYSYVGEVSRACVEVACEMERAIESGDVLDRESARAPRKRATESEIVNRAIHMIWCAKQGWPPDNMGEYLYPEDYWPEGLRLPREKPIEGGDVLDESRRLMGYGARRFNKDEVVAVRSPSGYVDTGVVVDVLCAKEGKPEGAMYAVKFLDLAGPIHVTGRFVRAALSTEATAYWAAYEKKRTERFCEMRGLPSPEEQSATVTNGDPPPGVGGGGGWSAAKYLWGARFYQLHEIVVVRDRRYPGEPREEDAVIVRIVTDSTTADSLYRVRLADGSILDVNGRDVRHATPAEQREYARVSGIAPCWPKSLAWGLGPFAVGNRVVVSWEGRIVSGTVKEARGNETVVVKMDKQHGFVEGDTLTIPIGDRHMLARDRRGLGA